LVSVTSCEEKPTIIGSGLLPATDFVKIKSDTTIGVDAYTLDSAAIITNSRTYSYIGRLYDPYFGDTRSDFVSQLRLSGPWPGGGVPTVDSVFLHFSINGAKGTPDSTTIRVIKIYEIDEILNSTSYYYSNRDPKVKRLIGTFPLPVIAKDSIQSITIELPKPFGQDLLTDTLRLSQDSNGNPFKSSFKGLYITMVDSPSPLLVAMEFSSSNFLIRVHYKTPKASNLVYDFIINSNSVRYNRYEHKFSTAAYASWRQHVINKTKDTMIYLQAFNGVSPQLRIPGLKAYKKILVDSLTNVVHGSVNKARLTFSVFLDSINYSSKTVPLQILMKYTKSDTIKYIVPDYQVNPAFFDGVFNSSKKTYSFNLAVFVQEYLKGNISDPVVEMYYPEGEYRNVILKANDSHSPVKFDFIYTRF
jgi:hypothetical protein